MTSASSSASPMLAACRAATRAGVPKSSLSRALGRLEGALKVRLFERGGRTLRLSEAGGLLLPHARRIIDDVAEANAAREGMNGAPRGTLRINAAVTYALGLIAPMLPDFIERYPEVRVVLETENRIVDLMREEVDVAIRIGALPDSDLIARKLGRIELWPCANPDYLTKHGTPRRRPTCLTMCFWDDSTGRTSGRSSMQLGSSIG